MIRKATREAAAANAGIHPYLPDLPSMGADAPPTPAPPPTSHTCFQHLVSQVLIVGFRSHFVPPETDGGPTDQQQLPRNYILGEDQAPAFACEGGREGARGGEGGEWGGSRGWEGLGIEHLASGQQQLPCNSLCSNTGFGTVPLARPGGAWVGLPQWIGRDCA